MQMQIARVSDSDVRLGSLMRGTCIMMLVLGSSSSGLARLSYDIIQSACLSYVYASTTHTQSGGTGTRTMREVKGDALRGQFGQ